MIDERSLDQIYQEALEHYQRTGSFREEDLQRIFGGTGTKRTEAFTPEGNRVISVTAADGLGLVEL